jgi:hypothetical protein
LPEEKLAQERTSRRRRICSIMLKTDVRFKCTWDINCVWLIMSAPAMTCSISATFFSRRPSDVIVSGKTISRGDYAVSGSMTRGYELTSDGELDPSYRRKKTESSLDLFQKLNYIRMPA